MLNALLNSACGVGAEIACYRPMSFAVGTFANLTTRLLGVSHFLSSCYEVLIFASLGQLSNSWSISREIQKDIGTLFKFVSGVAGVETVLHKRKPGVHAGYVKIKLVYEVGMLSPFSR